MRAGRGASWPPRTSGDLKLCVWPVPGPRVGRFEGDSAGAKWACAVGAEA